jgi:hypothetical protein
MDTDSSNVNLAGNLEFEVQINQLIDEKHSIEECKLDLILERLLAKRRIRHQQKQYYMYHT